MFGEAFVRSLREWHLTRRTRRELRGLSDAQLADIGIRRGDIEDIARGRHPRALRR